MSDGLDSLAEQHPVVSEALLGISGNVRNTTLLEVLVTTKVSTLWGLDAAYSCLGISVWSPVVCSWGLRRGKLVVKGAILEVNGDLQRAYP